jgi:hypothetical protein
VEGASPWSRIFTIAPSTDSKNSNTVYTCKWGVGEEF